MFWIGLRFKKKSKRNMVFKIVTSQKARLDILEGVEYYNKKASDLGKHFFQTIQVNFKTLSINPFFQVRYNDVHCLPMKKFPYMIHFIVNEKRNQVIILGVICTHRNPKIWEEQ